MASQPHPEVSRILQILGKGLHRTALAQAEKLRVKDDPAGRLAMMQIFAEMNDSLGFVSCLSGLDQSEIPENLLPFAIRALTFTGQKETASHWAESLLEHTATDDRKIVVAAMFEEMGDLEQAKQIFHELGQVALQSPRASLLQARFALADKNYPAAVEILEAAKLKFPRGLGPISSRMTQAELGFLLSRAYDKLGQYDSAWAAAADAHTAKPEVFDVDQYESEAERIMDFFTRSRIKKLHRASEQPVEPLLVMGNPRSGTTLLDTILGMHPEVVSGGELSIGSRLQNKLEPLLDSYLSYPDCLTELRVQDANTLAHAYSEAVRPISKGKRFVTNKALNINAQLGFLRCVAPGLRTISLHRHPLDNCVSCFMSLIPMRGHGYVQDQELMARVWIARRRLQDHWAEVLDDEPMLQLHYESMVNNQEHETRRILDFLSLEFTADCLRFHESESIAATVSSKQVQQPMYSTSAGRWKRYEKHLSVLIDRLGPWLEST